MHQSICLLLTYLALGSLGALITGSAPVHSSYEYRLVGGTCDLNQCLFIAQTAEENGLLSYVMGTARVTGYYGSIVRASGLVGTATPQQALTCPALTVTDAPPFFHTVFRDLVERGNTINQLDTEGRLVLALDTKSLIPSKTKMIEHATRQHPISLTLLKPTPSESEISGCDSLFEVLRVEKASH